MTSTKSFPIFSGTCRSSDPVQVWASDITLSGCAGFVYLVASWTGSAAMCSPGRFRSPLDVYFCLEALEKALAVGRSEIFNTDQGSQFTSREFTGMLLGAGIRVSMDGKGRAFDNIFIERLWRTVKYEEVYLKEYPDVLSACRAAGLLVLQRAQAPSGIGQQDSPLRCTLDVINLMGALPQGFITRRAGNKGRAQSLPLCHSPASRASGCSQQSPIFRAGRGKIAHRRAQQTERKPTTEVGQGSNPP